MSCIRGLQLQNKMLISDSCRSIARKRLHNASIRHGIDFLIFFFSEGERQYSTLTYTGSIQYLFLQTENKLEFRKHHLVQIFMKGIYLLCPNLLKCVLMWDFMANFLLRKICRGNLNEVISLAEIDGTFHIFHSFHIRLACHKKRR